MITCLECDKKNMDGTLFCENCGADLTDAAIDQSSAELAEVMSINQPNLKLIVNHTGEEILLPEKDEVIIGREDPVSAIFPDVDTTAYGGDEDGVSRKHARIFRENDSYFVEDLNTTNASFLNKTKLAPETPSILNDGDELMLGRLKFKVVLS